MTTNVLILCTHNSARSVLSEGMLGHWAARLGKDVKAFSAGSAPSGRINPFALEVLGNAGIDTSSFRSKSWNEFASTGAPGMRASSSRSATAPRPRSASTGQAAPSRRGTMSNAELQHPLGEIAKA